MMTQSNTIRHQQAQRILELFAIARQRYLDAGGNPQRTPSGFKEDDYMTDEERQEALVLVRQIFPQEYVDSFLQQRQNS
ncbi:MAG: hypothetical protein RMY28_034125 [Nostoc sp. ChiSLP01]|nr:hypothetical protein [Nostoc sp. CmiSLP01]MDZ8286663.1 hypothetical protein [Nostoc sp. ChiSLP01]